MTAFLHYVYMYYGLGVGVLYCVNTCLIELFDLDGWTVDIKIHVNADE